MNLKILKYCNSNKNIWLKNILIEFNERFPMYSGGFVNHINYLQGSNLINLKYEVSPLGKNLLKLKISSGQLNKLIKNLYKFYYD